ncbi:MAG: hypothetical protein AAB402_05390 [Patescibacteria group bacterium]
MARYVGRQLPGSPSTGSNAGGFFNFTKQLVARRGATRQAPKKIAPLKPSLITSKQKEAEIQKTLSTEWMPSGLKLAKLRQLAAQGKVLGDKARDFLARSEAGKKIEGSDSLKKYEAELLRAELEATPNAGGHSPLKYELRKEGTAHLETKAKTMVRGLYQDAAKQAKEQAAQSTNLTAMQQRQARLATIHAVIGQRQQPPAGYPAPASRSATPTLITPTPLTETEIPDAPRSGSPLYTAPTGIGSHIPGVHATGDSPVTGFGLPVVAHREPTTAPTASDAPISEHAAPAEATAPASEPFNQPMPSRPAVPAESPHIGGAGGGSGDDN